MQQQMTADEAHTNLAPIPMECDAPFLKVGAVSEGITDAPLELPGRRHDDYRRSIHHLRPADPVAAFCDELVARRAVRGTQTRPEL